MGEEMRRADLVRLAEAALGSYQVQFSIAPGLADGARTGEYAAAAAIAAMKSIEVACQAERSRTGRAAGKIYHARWDPPEIPAGGSICLDVTVPEAKQAEWWRVAARVLPDPAPAVRVEARVVFDGVVRVTLVNETDGLVDLVRPLDVEVTIPE